MSVITNMSGSDYARNITVSTNTSVSTNHLTEDSAVDFTSPGIIL